MVDSVALIIMALNNFVLLLFKTFIADVVKCEISQKTKFKCVCITTVCVP